MVESVLNKPLRKGGWREGDEERVCMRVLERDTVWVWTEVGYNAIGEAQVVHP